MHENTLNLRSVGEMGVLAYRYACPYFQSRPGGTTISGEPLFAHRFASVQRSISVLKTFETLLGDASRSRRN
jgi:hypothetical protein